MKLKKINDNQIQCIFTADELSSENIAFSDIVRGTPAARAVIDKVLRWALIKFQFQLNGMPFRIEAIPSQDGSVVVRITRVSPDAVPGPDGAAPADTEPGEDEPEAGPSPQAPGAPPADLLPPATPHTDIYTPEHPIPDAPCLWNFPDLASTLCAVSSLPPLPPLESSLYRDDIWGGYDLIIWQFPESLTADQTNALFDAFSEFSFRYAPPLGYTQHLAERQIAVLETDALAWLASAALA